MSGFLERFNTDDVFMRGLIASMLKSMNDKLKYTQVNDQQDVIEVYVPFYYSLSGDESLIQDNFVIYETCDGDELPAEGNYDVLPRGIVNYQSSVINTEALTNKYVRGSYATETTEGEMKTMSSYINSIPLTVDFNVTMKTDTLLDAFKLYQNVITTYHKTYIFSFEFEGIRIPCQIGFSENIEIDKQFEFSFSNSQENILFSFTVSVETYLPAKDLSTERFRGNLMQGGIKIKNLIDPNVDITKDRDIL